MKKRIEPYHIRLVMIVSSDIHVNPLSFIEEVLRHGVTMIQLRERQTQTTDYGELTTFAEEILALCKKYNVPMIVNGDVQLAESIRADGIHLEQNNSVYKNLPMYFNDKIVGLSIKNKEEFYNSDLTKVSYISAGRVFNNDTGDTEEDAIGLKGLEKLYKLVGDFPTLATGGINGCNYRDCLNAGADGVGVIRGIRDSEDIETTIRQLLGKTEI